LSPAADAAGEGIAGLDLNTLNPMAAAMTTKAISSTGTTGDLFGGACLGTLFIDCQSNRPETVKQALTQ
jgi:hypothetical protein